MAAPALFHELRRAGVEFSTDGERLRWRSATGLMTPEAIEVIRNHKAVIIDLLTGVEISASTEFSEDLCRPLAELERLAQEGDLCSSGRKYIGNAIAFIKSGWADRALGLGWAPERLFHVDPRAPWLRFDRIGAAFLATNVTAITDETMVMRASREGSIRLCRGRRAGDGAFVWDVIETKVSAGARAELECAR